MNKQSLMPLRRLHGRIYSFKNGLRLRQKYKREFRNNPNTVFLVMTPEHGNVGDHAIALAETKLLTDTGIKYIEITGKQIAALYADHQLWVMNGFPILINGGGFLGTLWFFSEKMTRGIIINNPKSRILIFPNTIFYENDTFGKCEFEKSKAIYNRHKNLYIYAREKKSFEIMREAYNNVKLIPDMVLSLDAYNSSLKRSGCLICLREDCERTRSEEEESKLKEICNSLFPNNVRYTDMVIDKSIRIKDRKNAVENKMKEFSSAELVITDRLHGMVFCAITGTPCIVINSKSPKVLGCYEWIKNLDYIRIAKSAQDIESEYKSISRQTYSYDNKHLLGYYEELKNDIKNLCIIRKTAVSFPKLTSKNS